MSKILNGLPEHPLTQDEENILARDKDSDAKSKLVLHAMHEAVPYAIRCCRAALPEDEVFSLCYAAMVKAAKNFKPDNIRFFAYCKVYIRGEISRNWKTKDAVRNSSLHETETNEIPEKEYYRTPSYDVEDEIGVELQGQARTQKDIEMGTAIDFRCVEPEYDAIDLREKWTVVEPLLCSLLNERERTVLRLYYDAGFPFEKIGDMLVPSVSRAAVQSTHFRALKKVRASLARAKKLRM